MHLLLTLFAALSLLVQLTLATFYSPEDNIVELTPDNFDTLVLNDNSEWVVEFYAPWCHYSQAFVQDYKSLAKNLSGIAKFGAVDADKYTSLSKRYEIDSYPTILFFGANKTAATEYLGKRNVDDLSKAVLAEVEKNKASIPENDVCELTDANFDSTVIDSNDVWLVDFFAPWCGYSKRLIPEWENAALQLRGRVRLGAIDVTANFIKAQEYGIQRSPTIKFFAGGRKYCGVAEDYNGPRTAADIVAWVTNKLYFYSVFQ